MPQQAPEPLPDADRIAVNAVVRLPVLAALVSGLGMPPVLAQGLTLGAAFVLRFLFTSIVVYAPRPGRPGVWADQEAPRRTAAGP